MKELILLLQRKKYNATNIIGELFANGRWICYVLEDQLRSDGVKVDGETCIPAGEYNVTLTMSSRFGRIMPLVYNTSDLKVSGHGKVFAGVRLHGGNTEADTHGCPLVAYTVNAEQTRVQGSAEKEITAMIQTYGGKAKLIIEDKGVTGGGLNKTVAK